MVFIHWIPALLYMAGIFIVSSVPDVGPLPGGVSDKSWHTIAYAGLGVVVLYAVARGRVEAVGVRQCLFAFLIAWAYGLTDEWHQSFVPGRTAEWGDVRANAIGAALGVGLAKAAAAVRARMDGPGGRKG